MSIVDLISKFERLPPEKQSEVVDFVEFLYERAEPAKKKAVFGSFKGEIMIADDFDAPLEDFKDYM
jgi:Protein of unknown function (DUF2281)